jgi:hypothetical protein
MLRIDGKGRGKELTIRILPRSEAEREELRTAVLGVLDQYFS